MEVDKKSNGRVRERKEATKRIIRLEKPGKREEERRKTYKRKENKERTEERETYPLNCAIFRGKELEEKEHRS